MNGYVRDRSFYASRPRSSGPIKIHRESTDEPGMAACDTHYILLSMDNPWDVDRAPRSMLCRRCFPRELSDPGATINP